MIDRYSLPDMRSVWAEETKLEVWRDIELTYLRVLAEDRRIPATVPVLAARVPAPLPKQVEKLEQQTGHDVVAFIEAWTSGMEPAAARWVHYGLTSSDITDTALAMRLDMASKMLLSRASSLVAALRDHATEHGETPRAGRTHGIHAEPTTWGMRVAEMAFTVARCRDRLAAESEVAACGKLSGPVGTYTGVTSRQEAKVMHALGLRAPDAATQVVARDGLAGWVSALAILGTACEAVALEVRHGQRTEVGELYEPSGDGQKGSSSMPHKRNPVRSERVCGLARVLRSYVTPVTEGMALWHERDISHSSAERIVVPDAAILADFVLSETEQIVRGLEVDKDRMLQNMETTGLMRSGAVLRELVAGGMQRDEAYRIVQEASRHVTESGMNLRDCVLYAAGDRDVMGAVTRATQYPHVGMPLTVLHKLEKLS